METEKRLLCLIWAEEYRQWVKRFYTRSQISNLQNCGYRLRVIEPRPKPSPRQTLLFN